MNILSHEAVSFVLSHQFPKLEAGPSVQSFACHLSPPPPGKVSWGGGVTITTCPHPSVLLTRDTILHWDRSVHSLVKYMGI